MKSASILLLACAGLLHGCAEPSRSRALGDPAIAGQVIAQQVCSNCHGLRGVSLSENFPSLAAQQAQYLEGQLRSLRDRHRRDPGGFVYMWGVARGLSDAQIQALASYYAAQPAPEAAPVGLQAPAAGKLLFTQGAAERGIPACASCHGDNGEGAGPIPRLAHQHRAYLLRQLSILRRESDNRPMGDVMNAVAHRLDDEDMSALADYIVAM